MSNPETGENKEELLDSIEALEAAELAQELADEEALAAEEAANNQAGVKAPPVDPVVALKEENAELKDKVLRMMAEMENLRRRTDREKSEATLYAATNFARDLLPVADSLGMALSSMDEEAREKADDAVKNLMVGLDLTQREFLNALHKHNITKLEPLGEKFDPHFHQAMFEVPDPNAVNGTVAQVVQAGYSIGERVLRPAMVGVVKSDKK